MGNKDVLKITFDANAGIAELEQNLISSMSGMSEIAAQKLEEAFAKAGRKPKLKKQFTGLYQELFDGLGAAGGELKEIDKVVERFAGRIDFIYKVANKSGIQGLFDNLDIGNMDKALAKYDEFLDKQKEIDKYSTNEFKIEVRTKNSVSSLEELTKTYGDVGKAQEKYENQLNEYVKEAGIESNTISNEIKQYSSLIALFEKINKTKVNLGTEDAVKKSQALLFVMEQITSFESGSKLFEKFRTDKLIDIDKITSSLDVLGQSVEGSITSYVDKLVNSVKSEINGLYDAVAKEVMKMSKHQAIKDTRTQTKINNTLGNNSDKGKGTGNGGNGDNQPYDIVPDIDEPDELDLWAKSAEELADEFGDVIKYATDVESSLKRINEIWDKYTKGKSFLDGEIEEMFTLMKRLDSLEQNGVIDKSPLNKEQLEEFNDVLFDEEYEKVFERIDQLTDKQLKKIEQLKAETKTVLPKGRTGDSGDIDDSKVEELRQEIQEVKEDITSLKGRVDTLEDTTAFDNLSSQVVNLDQQVKETDSTLLHLKDTVKDLTKNNIKIFDGDSEIILDSVKDAEKLEEILDRLAEKMVSPVFHTGNLEKNVISDSNFKPGDNLKFVTERGRSDSIGSGIYYSSNLADIIEWMQEHGEQARQLYLDDLDKYSSQMIKLTTEEEIDNFSALLKDITTSVMGDTKYWDMYSNEGKRFNKITPETLYQEHKVEFENYKITLEQLKKFILEQIEYVNSFSNIDSMEYVPSVGTNFQKELLNSIGLDLSNNVIEDSVARGSIVFEVNEKQPYTVNFGDNTEVAKKFFEKIYKKILVKKAAYEDNNIDNMLFNYADVLPFEEGSDTWDSFRSELLEIQRNQVEQVKKGYAEEQDSHSPSKEAEKLNDDFVAGIEESADKNEDKLKNVGRQMAENVKDGFKEGLSEIEGITLSSDEDKKPVLSGDQSSVLSGTTLPALQQEESKVEDINEDLEKQSDLYKQIYERVEKIRMLGTVGANKKDENDIVESYGKESRNAEAFKIQMDAIKTLSPTGEMNPDIRDMVLNSELSIEEVTQKLVEAAEEYITCKKALDDMFAKAGITGGKVYDDAYRNLNMYSIDSEGMFGVIGETREKLALIKSENAAREEAKKKKEAETQAQVELNKEKIEEARIQAELTRQKIYGSDDQTEVLSGTEKPILETAQAQEKLEQETNETTEAVEKQTKAYKEWSSAIKYGIDRQLRAKELKDHGLHPSREKLLSNKTIWDEVVNNGWLQDIPEGIERKSAYEEIRERIIAKILENAGLTAEQYVKQIDFGAQSYKAKSVNGNLHTYYKTEVPVDPKDWIQHSQNSGWNFYHKTGSGKFEGDTTYKIYAAFEKLGDFTKETISEIMNALTKAGFKGDLKTARQASSAGDTDQIVIHAINEQMQELAYKVLAKYGSSTGKNFSYLGGGFDKKDNTGDNSFSSLLEQGDLDVEMYKRLAKSEDEARKASKQSADQQVNDLNRVAEAQNRVNESKKEATSLPPEANQTPLSLIEESSGQLALFENVEERQKELKKTVEQTNDSIEGQINLLDYLDEQVSKNKPPSTPPSEPPKPPSDDFFEETSGQLAMFEGLEESQKETEVAIEKTNDAIKGQITVEEYLENQTKETAKAYDDLVNRLDDYFELKNKEAKGTLSQGKNGLKNSKLLEELESNIQDATLAQGKYANITSEGAKAQERFNTKLKEYNELSGANYIENTNNRLDILFNTEGKTKAYYDQINNIRDKVSALKKNLSIDFTDESLKKQQNVIEELINLLGSKEFKAVSSEKTDKFITRASKLLNQNTAMDASYKKQLSDLIHETERLKNSTEGLNEIKFNELSSQLASLESKIVKSGKTGLSVVDKIKKKFKDLVAYFSTYVSTQDFIQTLRNGFETIKEYDSALTEMNKVSKESIQTLKEFQQESFKLADSVGTTAFQIQNSTADFLRLGETFEQAKQSAQDANALFKVSEFESINEATDALISMSQAYKELEKGEINDILNYVGNNFSLSTSDLASALQDAAAVLKTQGNSIYEAVALITAGNAITQDPVKTAGGVRTISLRLAGTEEAKAELESLGESVDDYIVQTESKTQQTIKNLTAVASNAGKGIDVLDANGNLRNTYDILLDISKIYKEIQEEDKKAGTNRANALVEYVAGKNRSNIASSILLNPQLLEKVKSSAMANAEGSVAKEMEAQLESIESHLNSLKNAWDNLWVNDDNREIITFFIDLAKSILEVVKSFGTLNSLIIGGAGIFTALKGGGRIKKFILNNKYATEEFSGDVYELYII